MGGGERQGKADLGARLCEALTWQTRQGRAGQHRVGLGLCEALTGQARQGDTLLANSG